MRILLFGKETAEIAPLFSQHTLVDADPELIVTWGGDGTLLLAEHTYPGIPKLALGKSTTCKKCIYPDVQAAAAQLAPPLRIIEHPKLLARLNGKALPLALNDVVVRNKDQMHAIRFIVNGEEEHIGDGIVVATAFGSTAYFASITRTAFSSGIGVAFNNTIREQAPMSGDGPVRLELTRGDALISIDTLEDTHEMRTGDVLEISLSSEVARIVELRSQRSNSVKKT